MKKEEPKKEVKKEEPKKELKKEEVKKEEKGETIKEEKPKEEKPLSAIEALEKAVLFQLWHKE